MDLYLIGLAHLGVLGQHLLKGLRHRIAPEEVVVEGSVRVDPGQLVEGEKNTKEKKTSVCYLAEGLRVSSLSKRSTAHWSFTYGFNLSLTRLYIM